MIEVVALVLASGTLCFLTFRIGIRLERDRVAGWKADFEAWRAADARAIKDLLAHNDQLGREVRTLRKRWRRRKR